MFGISMYFTQSSTTPLSTTKMSFNVLEVFVIEDVLQLSENWRNAWCLSKVV